MFLDYNQQLELINDYRREMEKRAARERLYRLVEKSQPRAWSIANFLKPRIVGGDKWNQNETSAIPIQAQVCSPKSY